MSCDKDANLFVHVFDDQQHRAVQASHVPVQSLQAAPVDGCAVDQLPRISLGPRWHLISKLLETESLIKRCHTASYRKIIIITPQGKTFVNGCSHCQVVHSLSLGGGPPAADCRHSGQGVHLHPGTLPQSPPSYTDSGDAWSPSL